MRRCRIALNGELISVNLKSSSLVLSMLLSGWITIGHQSTPAYILKRALAIHCFQKDNPRKWHKGEREVN